MLAKQDNKSYGSFMVIQSLRGFNRCLVCLALIFGPRLVLGSGQVIGWGNASNVPASASNSIAISAGYYLQGSHIALKEDGTIVSWNNSGPVATLAGLSNVIEVASGYYSGNGIALKTDGTVAGWGGGNLAALTTLSNIVSVEKDDLGSTCLRADGSVARVVFNGVTNPPELTNVISLFPFNYGFIALRADGTFFVDSQGGLSVSPSNNVMTLAAGGYRAGQGLLLRRDGSLVGWGNPTNAPPAGTNFIGVAASMDGKFVLRSDGTVTGWSSSYYPDVLTNYPAGLTNIVVIDGGGGSMLALRMNRTSLPVNLSDALNTTALVVSSKGSSQWFTQTNVTKDGLHAARSGAIGHGTASSMRLWTNGPVTVSFWWKTSSETNHDFLTFSAGGVALTNISGETGWQQCTITTPPGNQLLQWAYSKDGAGSGGSDAAWVDQIVIARSVPLLTITRSNTFISVSWPSSATGWTLQTNDNLATGAWGNYSGNNVNNRLTNYLPTGNLFFRLKK